MSLIKHWGSALLLLAASTLAFAANANSNLPDVFLRTHITDGQAGHYNFWLQNQLSYTLQVFYALPLAKTTLRAPTMNGAIIFRLGEDQHAEELLGGRTYHVITRHYAIVPERAGTFVIESPILQTQLVIKADQTPPETTPLTVTTTPMTVTVQPIPADFAIQNWLPARNLIANQTWTGLTNIKVGQTITRLITIHALGLPADQIPLLKPSSLDHAKVYLDETKLSNELKDKWVLGRKQQAIAYVPTKSGTLLLPAIQIPWWNVITNQKETITLPGQTVVIAPITNLRKNNWFAQHFAWEESNFWPWLTFIFAGLWLLSCTGFLYQKIIARKKLKLQQQQTHMLHIARKKAWLLARKQLQQACEKNEPRAIMRAIVAWSKVQWPEIPLHNLNTVIKRCKNPALQQTLDSLSRFLYAGNQEASWQDGALLWQQFKMLESVTNLTTGGKKKLT